MQAAEDIRELIAGRNPKGFTEVRMGDVVEVIAAIPESERTKKVAALHLGASNLSEDASAHQRTDHLVQLIEVFDKTRPEVQALVPQPAAEEAEANVEPVRESA